MIGHAETVHIKTSSEHLKSTFFLNALTAQTAQTEEFMFQNVVYRPTVYRTGSLSIKDCHVKWKAGSYYCAVKKDDVGHKNALALMKEGKFE